MRIPAHLSQAVRERAGHACEYCRVPAIAYATVTFPVDHVIARQHGGETVLSNLALSCLNCNGYKGPNIAGNDPVSGKLVRLFHPRRNRWATHFRWVGPRILGRTPVGRATAEVLRLNAKDFVEAREDLIAAGILMSKS
jgi:hypothetical protein